MNNLFGSFAVETSIRLSRDEEKLNWLQLTLYTNFHFRFWFIEKSCIRRLSSYYSLLNQRRMIFFSLLRFDWKYVSLPTDFSIFFSLSSLVINETGELSIILSQRDLSVKFRIDLIENDHIWVMCFSVVFLKIICR